MHKTISALIDKDLPLISNLSNLSACLNSLLDNINWVGFYLKDNKGLYLGPFQGEVACYRIPFHKGVCGECLDKKETIVVDDVLIYPNHIACSAKSRSEIVIPLFKDDEVVALLDIDAPIKGRFSNKDKEELEKVAREIEVLFK